MRLAATGGTPGYSDALDFDTWAGGFGHPSPQSDDDFDGLTALVEFATGSDPNVADPPPLGIQGKEIVLTKSLSAEGVELELESATDLLGRQTATDGGAVFVAEENLASGRAILRFRYTGAAPGSPRFFRLKVRETSAR